jgi:hypothetical protein
MSKKAPSEVLFSVMSAAAILGLYFNVEVCNEPGTLGEKFCIKIRYNKPGWCQELLISTGYVECGLEEAITIILKSDSLKNFIEKVIGPELVCLGLKTDTLDACMKTFEEFSD